ncbi:MAG: acyl-CoA dehydrogenase family protein [Desertimonas sp.]
MRGDLVGCQLYSEPEAGSDLASLRTTATRDGAEWRLNGQKVWTSWAHQADVAQLLCRTSTASKHGGITAFLVDMRQPGIEVRPLRQMTGGAEFNEVFLTDAVATDANRLGEVGEGWAVSRSTLVHERASIAKGNIAFVVPAIIERLAGLLRDRGLRDSAVLRDRLARTATGILLASWNDARLLALAPDGPGPEMSMSKLAHTQNATAVGEFASAVLGSAVQADTGVWGTYAWARTLLGAPGLRIAGGTDEIQRNILAERVLGLPR